MKLRALESLTAFSSPWVLLWLCLLFSLPAHTAISKDVGLKPISSRGFTRIDLHNHAFMKEGGNWLMKGHFNENLKANSWKSRFSSKSNLKALLNSKASIVVVSIYANEIFGEPLKKSVRKQIRAAKQFVKSHPQWVIAEGPAQARAALGNGKQVIILSLEGAAGIIETKADLKEFIGEGKIRIVTPLHFVDDHYGGAAFMGGVYSALNPLSIVDSLLNPVRKNGVRVNAKGLTPRGKWLVRNLLEKGVWIDLSHASDESQRGIYKLLREFKQPFLFTHTAPRKFIKSERGISERQLLEVKESDGIVGLLPSAKYLVNTPPMNCNLPAGQCAGTVHALSTQFNYVSELIGSESTLVGTDFNSPLEHLKPGMGTGTSLDVTGFWNMGQFEELWVSLKRSGASLPESQGAQLRNFLAKWEKVQAHLPEKSAL